MSQRCKPPRLAFAGATHVAGPKGCHAVLFGAPHGTPYPLINNRVHEEAPEALRSAMSEDARWINHWDFDLGGTLTDGRDFRSVIWAIFVPCPMTAPATAPSSMRRLAKFSVPVPCPS
jgi:hypothetical protein